ncbi:MAG: hypothetical protein RLZZ361_617 [Cyanobacteriota bacterium]|jgi:septum formation protein
MTKIHSKKPIILASGSQTRKEMLERIDLNFQVVIPSVNEEALKLELKDLAPEELGMQLALAKALAVSQEYPSAFVIAGDQICLLDNKIFDKPLTTSTCADHLRALSGKTHSQNCFAVICHDNKLLWKGHYKAYLTMRALNDSEINSYIELENPINSCGSYMFEKHGKYLFSNIEGDQDVILGLPLVPILNKLFELDIIFF